MRLLLLSLGTEGAISHVVQQLSPLVELSQAVQAVGVDLPRFVGLVQRHWRVQKPVLDQVVKI